MMMVYLLKVNVLLAIFYGFYRLMFVRDTFFTWRRAVLLLSALAAVAIPMVDIGWWVNTHPQAANLSEVYREVVLPTVKVTGTGDRFPWLRLFTIIYICGIVLFAARMVWQMLTIVWMRATHDRSVIDGCEVVVIGENASPFSFFSWVFVNPEMQSSAQLHEVLLHEQAHVHQLHTLDVVVMELLAVFCWWNPFVWLLRREVRMNLEYLADERVVEVGNERRAYQYHLLGLAYGKNVATVCNNFNVLPLKLRIKMMNKRRTNRWLRAKYLLMVPVAAAALVACNLDSKPQSAQESEVEGLPDTVAISVDRQSGMDTMTVADSPSEGYFDNVEQMPEYPGGQEELMKFLQTNVKYPKEATDKGIQGRVLVQFIVKSDGSISDAKVVREAHPLLDAEALRVVKSMPKWKPGMQSGKIVNVKYVIPVTFRLQ
ncbi:MAG: M56 family metallopeptidase [Prevotella sp.]|nr:M56 family metallopeptidase [Prevotella sp.]